MKSGFNKRPGESVRQPVRVVRPHMLEWQAALGVLAGSHFLAFLRLPDPLCREEGVALLIPLGLVGENKRENRFALE